MLQKLIKGILLTSLAVILVFTAIVGYLFYTVIHKNKYKSHVQTIELASQNIKFVLMTDFSGFEDPAWYVYRLPIGAKLTEEMNEGHNKDTALFWNYAEAGNHTFNAKISVEKGKYLLFSRGDRYHSLYDFDTKTVLVNIISPWNSALYDEENHAVVHESPLPEFTDRFPDIDPWVKENLHSKIVNILGDN